MRDPATVARASMVNLNVVEPQGKKKTSLSWGPDNSNFTMVYGTHNYCIQGFIKQIRTGETQILDTCQKNI